ncbi:MAG: ABC-type transport system involved in cytochrome c biogenesis permease subunit [Verrucomicrobiales bacterium]|jgi:ABC-type transport system involved in cytochrome c biogenesis permease subunit
MIPKPFLLRVLYFILTAFQLTVGVHGQDDTYEAGVDPNLIDAEILAPEWSDETVRLFEELVLQDERLKPVSTYAAVKLLKFRGIKGVRLNLIGGGKRDLSPAAWMLDTLFYPEIARQYPIFLVEDRAALDIIGLDLHKKRRERYSFEELAAGRDKLNEAAQRYIEIESSGRTAVQTMVVDLANNVADFEYILKSLDFARMGMPVYRGEEQEGELERVPASTFLRDELEAMVEAVRSHGTIQGMPPRLSEAASEYLALAQAARGSIDGVHFFPGYEPEGEEWFSCGELLFLTMQRVPQGGAAADPEFAKHRDWAAERLEQMESLVAARDDRELFRNELHSFKDARAADIAPLIAAAKEPNAAEWKKWQARQFTVAPVEIDYQHGKFFFKAWATFVALMLGIAVTWLAPGARWSQRLRKVIYFATFIPLALIVVGVAYRVYIMGRPPVAELYETVPYITFIVIVACLILDRTLKLRIMLPLACAMGALGLFVADRYEAIQGADTMKELTAVLRSNFWLTTHVLVVLVGYAAGILASVMSGIYIISRVLDVRRKKSDYFRTLSRATYGIICFGLLFSLVGTVLGGIWANYSWGRFWGWDPKENGALMIVLWFLMILHARVGGFIKEFGLHLLSVIGGAVVVFSWFHTNQLGVGLHSYGFTSGVMFAINTAYGILLTLFVIGSITAVIGNHYESEEKAARKKACADSQLPDGAGA